MRCEPIYLYPDRKDVSVTPYLITASNNIQQGNPRPLIIINPGGAYFYCSDREGEPIALAFNAMGYHAVVLRYSTYYETSEKVNDAPLVANPTKNYPSPMLEIAKTIALIYEYREEWHVDVNQIGLAGFSAGGHNVAMYGTQWRTPLIQEATDLKGSQLRPSFMILGYSVLDFLYYNEMKSHLMTADNTSLFKDMLIAYYGKNDLTHSELEKISPVYLVNSETPPTFLWATKEDELVDVQDTVHFSLQLARHNIPFELHVFEQGEHGLSTAGAASASRIGHINSSVQTWIPLVQKWLELRMSPTWIQ